MASGSKQDLRRNIDGLRDKVARLQNDTGVAELKQQLQQQRIRADRAEQQVRDLSRQLERERSRADRAETRIRSLGLEADGP